MKSILGNEQGATSLEVFIIMACFIVIAVIASLAMFAQGGQDTEDIAEAVATIESEVETYIEAVDWEQEIEDAKEIEKEIKYEVCCKLCEVDYNSGLTNITQYSNCLSYCD